MKPFNLPMLCIILSLGSERYWHLPVLWASIFQGAMPQGSKDQINFYKYLKKFWVGKDLQTIVQLFNL